MAVELACAVGAALLLVPETLLPSHVATLTPTTKTSLPPLLLRVLEPNFAVPETRPVTRMRPSASTATP